MSKEDAEEMAADTLAGDLRDVMLTHIRSMETPWSKLSEDDQGDKIYAIDNACRDIVRRAVAIIAARGFHTVHAVLENIAVKANKNGTFIEGKFSARYMIDNLDHLGANVTHPMMMVMASSADFMGEKGEAKADPDQPEIPFDDETEAAAETEDA